MNTTIPDFFKCLPVLSYLAYAKGRAKREAKAGANPIKILVKALGHLIYGYVIVAYVFVSLINGEANPMNWPDKVREENMRTERYRALYGQVVQYVDSDGIEGLSLCELDDLLRRAGATASIKVSEKIINLPMLSIEKLERALASYERSP